LLYSTPCPRDGFSASRLERDLIWLGSHRVYDRLEKDLAAALRRSCDDAGRCFVEASGEVDDIDEGREQLIWWHNPLRVLRAPLAQFAALRAAASVAPAPVLWNGQDTDNIFHLLVSFVSRLWLYCLEHAPDALQPPTDGAGGSRAVLIYVFDLHAGRPHLLGPDGRFRIPGPWAAELARLAFPGIRFLHARELLAALGGGPTLFPQIHFNMVNWGSWVLPSEDLHPPRLARTLIGPHPDLRKLPSVVIRALGLSRPSRLSVLLVQRLPPAGRRLANEALLLEGLDALGVPAQAVDLSLMTFAKQIEAVHHASVLLGVHGQGLFNLIFLPAGAAVVEVQPCGVAMSLTFNVAELFGVRFAEIL
ncbi:eogt, partial [Symbiodinium sp. CCMP2456]